MSRNPVALSHHPQLFLDDYLIQRVQGAERRLQRPVKHPANPVLAGEQPWETRMLQYPVVLRDMESDRFRMCFTFRFR